MTIKFTESVVETACIEYFLQLGYEYVPAQEIACDGLFAERASYGDVLLRKRLKASLTKINPTIPDQALDEAIRKLSLNDSPTAIVNNRTFHKYVTDGIDVSFRKGDRDVHDKVWMFDFHNLNNNDWMVLNQFTVVENHVNRRPDVIIAINGIPIDSGGVNM